MALEKIRAENREVQAGIEIVKVAPEAPLHQIVLNAGLDAKAVVEQVETGSEDYGFNAKSEQFELLLQAGGSAIPRKDPDG